MPAVSKFIDGTGPVFLETYSRSYLLLLLVVQCLDSMLSFHQVRRRR